MNDTCRQCGRQVDNPDAARLAAIKFSQTMCSACYRASKAKGYAAQALYCHVCGEPKAALSSVCQRCNLADRVGADYFACDCGQTVPIHESVRMMRKPSHRIERVCKDCAAQSSCCTAGSHPIVTPIHRDWDAAKFTFAPLPDGFRPGVCSSCGMQVFWDGKRWARMTWLVLADAWEKVDG